MFVFCVFEICFDNRCFVWSVEFKLCFMLCVCVVCVNCFWFCAVIIVMLLLRYVMLNCFVAVGEIRREWFCFMLRCFLFMLRWLSVMSCVLVGLRMVLCLLLRAFVCLCVVLLLGVITFVLVVICLFVRDCMIRTHIIRT